MVKLHKSSPVSKRNGVKKEFCHYVTDKQLIMNISLTAMGQRPGIKDKRRKRCN